jgi:sRNA-binding carbon storage regulator CsrA
MRNKQSPGLVIDLRQGECLSLSGAATVELLHKSGQAARLRVVAPREVRIEKLNAQQEREAVPSMAT